jgi:hypothetical protein
VTVSATLQYLFLLLQLMSILIYAVNLPVISLWQQPQVFPHASRLASQHALAGAYQSNGQIEQAVALLEHVATTRERALADE